MQFYSGIDSQEKVGGLLGSSTLMTPSFLSLYITGATL